MTTGEASLARVRVTYAIDKPLCYTSVLDMGRHWERIVRRARIPLAYSQGFHPHPRLLFAAPLPVGYRSTRELLDLYLLRNVDRGDVLAALGRQSPTGLAIVDVEVVPVNAPVLQAEMREAEYNVLVWSPALPEAVQAAIGAFLARIDVPRERERKGRTQSYNLRELFSQADYVCAEGAPGAGHTLVHTLHMRARCGSNGSGRPEELVEELDIPFMHCRVTRTRLIWGAEEENSA